MTGSTWLRYNDLFSILGTSKSARSKQELQQEMDRLSAAFQSQEHSTVLGEYAFIPARPRALPYRTANFLHSGWMHFCLKKLNRPAEALRNYKAAQTSVVPHLNWEANITMGFRARRKLRSPSPRAYAHRRANL